MDTANLFSVKGRVALVTGGSVGIGRMIATGVAAPTLLAGLMAAIWLA